MPREYRAMPAGEVRAVGERQFEARICSYNRADTFGSVWQPGVWSESLRTKLPKAVFSHDWSRIIGSVVDYRDGPDGLDVTVQLADFDAVSDARMVHSLLRDGHLDAFSFGFERRDWRQPTEAEQALWPGAKEVMIRATMDETSPVLAASVPGTATLAVRSAAAVDENLAVDASLVTDVAELLRTGAMDAEQARATLVAAARPVETPEETTLPLAPIEPTEQPGLIPTPETPEAPPLDPGGDPLEPVDPGPPVQPVDPEPADDGAHAALALATIDTALAGG